MMATPARDYLAPIGHGDCAPLIKIIEKVRADALEEAANTAENFAAAMNAMRTHPDPLPIDTNEGWRRVMDGALDIASAIRNLGDKA